MLSGGGGRGGGPWGYFITSQQSFNDKDGHTHIKKEILCPQLLGFNSAAQTSHPQPVTRQGVWQEEIYCVT